MERLATTLKRTFAGRRLDSRLWPDRDHQCVQLEGLDWRAQLT